MGRCLSILVKHARSLMAAKTNRMWALSAFFSVVSSIALAIALPRLVLAQVPIGTDRPDFVESSSTVGAGAIQIEGSFAFDTETIGVDNVDTWTTPFLFRVGISNSWELRLESDWFTRYQVTNQTLSNSPSEVSTRQITNNGISDVSVGVKWSFLPSDEFGRPAMAALVHVDLPIGSAELRGFGVRPSFRVVAEWSFHIPWIDGDYLDQGDFRGDWGIAVMPGLQFDQDEFSSYPSGVFGLVISRGLLSPRFRAFSEMAFEQIRKDEYGGHVGVIRTGGTFLLNDWWQIDSAIAFGLTDNAPNFGMTFGLSGLLLG